MCQGQDDRFMPKYVAYYRRWKTGGIDHSVQRAEIDAYVESKNGKVIGRFTEEEVGRYGRIDRIELRKALALCKNEFATLVSVRWTSMFRDQGLTDTVAKAPSQVDYETVDLPEHAFVTRELRNQREARQRERIAKKAAEETRKRAEQEAGLRRKISEGVSRSLTDEKLKTHGFANPVRRQNALEVQQRGRNTHTLLADDAAVALAPFVSEITASGVVNPEGIANELNCMGKRTRRGNVWSRQAVVELLKRIERLAKPLAE